MTHSWQQIWRTQQWPQEWKRSVFILVWKKGNAKGCLNYCITVLISHASKVMLKILQVSLQHYVNQELSDVQVGFRKGRGTRAQIANIHWIIEKARRFQKNICFCFIDYIKSFDCMDPNELWKILLSLFLTLILLFIYLAVPGLSCSMQDLVPWPGFEPRSPASRLWSPSHWTTREFSCGKFLKSLQYQTTLLVSWEACTQVKNQQLEPHMEQLTGSKLGKEYNKTVYCHPV